MKKSTDHLKTWYNEYVYKDLPIEKLIEFFIEKGGKINNYYIKNPKKTPTLVYYKNWFRGKNMRNAIMRALSA